MPRICDLTGKRASKGHNVSHSNRKTPRRFQPNLQAISLWSERLGQALQLRVATATVRTVQKRGGLDPYLLGTPDAELTLEGRRLKRRIARAGRER
jgi:large subunit ribosomal protein L28